MEQGTPIKHNIKQEITKRGKNCLPQKGRNHHRQNLNLFPKGEKSNEYLELVKILKNRKIPIIYTNITNNHSYKKFLKLYTF